jgi:hypothetical protein
MQPVSEVRAGSRTTGIDTFKGLSCHTHAWPKEGVDFAGKRVGIIGTGATAVQTIQEIAKTVGHLTVFPGVNRNVEGKQRPRIMRYSGGHSACRQHRDAIAAEGYRTLVLAWPRLRFSQLNFFA